MEISQFYPIFTRSVRRQKKMAEEVGSHPMQTPWTFYAYKRDRNVSYEDCIMKIAKVYTVEEFWAVFTRLARLDYLQTGRSVMFFRDDIRPMWEDEGNRDGGTFEFRFQSGNGPAGWEKLLLSLIGEQIDTDIIGVVGSHKLGEDWIVVWNRTSKDEQLKSKLAGQLFHAMDMPFKSECRYKEHEIEERKVSRTWILEADGKPVLKESK